MIIRHAQLVRAFHSLRAEEAINLLFNSNVLKVIISVPTEQSMAADNQYIIVIFTSITSINSYAKIKSCGLSKQTETDSE